jgi:hypothetical protein
MLAYSVSSNLLRLTFIANIQMFFEKNKELLKNKWIFVAKIEIFYYGSMIPIFILYITIRI